MTYPISLGMEKVSTIVGVLMEIMQNDGEESNVRLLAAQLVLVIGGYNLAEVTTP